MRGGASPPRQVRAERTDQVMVRAAKCRGRAMPSSLAVERRPRLWVVIRVAILTRQPSVPGGKAVLRAPYGEGNIVLFQPVEPARADKLPVRKQHRDAVLPEERTVPPQPPVGGGRSDPVRSPLIGDMHQIDRPRPDHPHRQQRRRLQPRLAQIDMTAWFERDGGDHGSVHRTPLWRGKVRHQTPFPRPRHHTASCSLGFLNVLGEAPRAPSASRRKGRSEE